jgi:ABC-type uncharacterized transport system substrate-binding protein
VRRRDLLGTFVGSTLLFRPLIGSAQRSDRVRHIGFLSPFREDDPENRFLIGAFRQTLRDLGWVEGGNISIEYRFTDGNVDRTRAAAQELVALAPDVLVAFANPAVSALQSVTRTIPIVFNQVSDPVGSGFVTALAHPGGNTTGFHTFEPAIGSKWLQLLKEIAPQLRWAALLYDPNIIANVGFLRAAETAAPSVGLAVRPAPVHDAADIRRSFTSFGAEPDGGLVVAPAPPTFDHRDLIVEMTRTLRLPAIYPYRFFIESGGLASYGFVRVEQFQQAANYVDRILRGANPAELPVQLPTKYELVVNLPAARAIGLTVPPSLLARADEVIE